MCRCSFFLWLGVGGLSIGSTSDILDPIQLGLKEPSNLWNQLFRRLPTSPQCTSIRGLIVSIRSYLGFLKGQLGSAGIWGLYSGRYHG